MQISTKIVIFKMKIIDEYILVFIIIISLEYITVIDVNFITKFCGSYFIK